MKRIVVITLILLGASMSFAQGIPFMRNYTAKEYQAHNRNFDVVTGSDGTVFFANFEGLLYYDNAEWRMIHTPGITRVTVIYRDKNDTIWVGGYNYFGRISTKPNGELFLQRVGSPSTFHGEVGEIWESNGELVFLVNEGNLFKVEGDQVILKRKISDTPVGLGLSDIVQIDAINNANKVIVMEGITQTEPMDNGLKAVVKRGEGLSITDQKDKELYIINEANGLCNDNIIWVSYNGHGQLWGATDNGVFALAVPSMFSRFTSHEGLMGDVLALEEYNGHIYAGTNRALFRQEDHTFVPVPGINHACWDLKKSSMGLLAATVNGIYCISGNSTRQLSNIASMALLNDGSQIYSGEMDGVYLIQLADKSRKKVCGLEKVIKILRDAQGTIWLQSMHGEVWCKRPADTGFQLYKAGADEAISTVVPLADRTIVVRADDAKPFPYPLCSYMDDSGVTWLTDNEGKRVYRWKDGKRLEDMDKLLHPFANTAVRSMYKRQQEVWLATDDGLVVIDTNGNDPALNTKSQLKFRAIWLNGDSLLWGGFGEMPEQLPQLKSHERNLRFTYALDYSALVGKTLYRYRLNNNPWSAWEDDKDAEFLNLPYGNYSLSIQALQADGELSEVTTLKFSIAYPIYMRWYMIAFYLLMAGLLIYGILLYRLHRLKLEKRRLESIVQERTAEVVKQKDEIEEKSKSLEKALDDLSNAQHELIRQEKMATAGKLTQGLIDRILNPLNYINNFAKLSEGLVKDLEANIEDDKDNMDGENYEDTMDVLGMLRSNLQKVSEHGQSTTRILKAMEEMLKDRTGGIVPMNLVPILRQDEEMLKNYFAEDISRYGIKTTFSIPQGPIVMDGNADQLSMTIMSLLGNAVYAVKKKAQRDNGTKTYTPEITLSVKDDETTTLKSQAIVISICDNGIGIEQAIINKVFDPFFTTKPTGEASGVGLYLSREIIQNHGGDISVKSVKDTFTEFIITLPIT